MTVLPAAALPADPAAAAAAAAAEGAKETECVDDEGGDACPSPPSPSSPPPPPPPATHEAAKQRGTKRPATEADGAAAGGGAAAEPAAQRRRRDRSYCFYYKAGGGGGSCREGDACPYIHDDAYARRMAAEEAEQQQRKEKQGESGGGGVPRTPFAAALHEEAQTRRVFVRPIVPPTDAEEAREAAAAVQAAVVAALAAELVDDVRTQKINPRSNFAVVTAGSPEAADALVAREAHLKVAWSGPGGGGGAPQAWAHRPHEFDAGSPYRRTMAGVGRVAKAKGHRVFVAGLGGLGALPDSRLAAAFSVAGQVVAVQRGSSAELGKQQHCFVEYAAREGARAAIELFHGNAYKGAKGEEYMLSVTTPM